MENTSKAFLTVPVAILIAGVLVAASIIYAVGRNSLPADVPADDVAQGSVDKVRPVSVDEHIWGDAKAPVKIVEFSDTECPFCKMFHPTMKAVVENYNGQIAWVYRHFPLDQIHPKARKEAEATECAGELGGNDKFWAYLDRLFEITPSNDGLNPAELPKIASHVGLKITDFNKCLNSGRYAKKVEDDYQDGLAAGAGGTPYSIVILPDGKKIVISGAQPLDNVKKILDLVLRAK
jgi:protein-disulfide isomerase